MDPSTKRTLTILGLIVLVLLALFIVAVAHNPDKGGGPGCNASERNKWRDRLMPGKPVAAGQLHGCTTALGTFTIPGACVLMIDAAKTSGRRLVIEAISPIKVETTTKADDREIKMSGDLKPGKTTQFSIGEGAEVIKLFCIPPTNNCQARLK